jgi:hypothetical protein
LVSPPSADDSQLSSSPSLNEDFLYRQLGASGSMLQGQIGLKAEFSFKANDATGSFATPRIPLFDGSDVRLDTLNFLSAIRSDQRPLPKTLLIVPDVNDIGSANSGWAKIAFQEEFVSKIVSLLRHMIPTIEGLQSLQQSPNTVSSFFIKLKGINDPQPLGSFGDGVRHILFLLLAFPNTPGGQVFIDEIGAAVHHSLMEDMWTVIAEFAHIFDVQIFATTHSLDCITGLSRVPVHREQIAIHRIDSSRKKSARYDFEEISAAIEEDQEIRGV